MAFREVCVLIGIQIQQQDYKLHNRKQEKLQMTSSIKFSAYSTPAFIHVPPRREAHTIPDADPSTVALRRVDILPTTKEGADAWTNNKNSMGFSWQVGNDIFSTTDYEAKANLMNAFKKSDSYSSTPVKEELTRLTAEALEAEKESEAKKTAEAVAEEERHQAAVLAKQNQFDNAVQTAIKKGINHEWGLAGHAHEKMREHKTSIHEQKDRSDAHSVQLKEQSGQSETQSQQLYEQGQQLKALGKTVAALTEKLNRKHFSKEGVALTLNGKRHRWPHQMLKSPKEGNAADAPPTETSEGGTIKDKKHKWSLSWHKSPKEEGNAADTQENASTPTNNKLISKRGITIDGTTYPWRSGFWRKHHKP